MSGVVLGNHHDARRAAVQAVDDTRARLASNAAEIRHVMEQRVDECSRWMTRARVHDEPGRFVDHGQVSILVQDFEWQRLTGHLRWRRVRNINGDALPVAHRKIRSRVAAFDRHVPVRDEFLDEGARPSFEHGHEKAVQPLTAEIGRHREFKRQIYEPRRI